MIKENKEQNEEVEIIEETEVKEIKKEIPQKNFVYTTLEGRFIHVKVGDANLPANDEEVKKIQADFNKFINDNNIDCLVYVSHHAVKIEVIA